MEETEADGGERPAGDGLEPAAAVSGRQCGCRPSPPPVDGGSADFLPPHDVYFLDRDAMTATEPSLELVERFQPNLLPLAEGTTGHRSFLNCDKLKQAAGWEHRATWRG